MNNNQIWDTVVIGGGIAGLVASNYLSREGCKVLLLEKGSEIGGRSITNRIGDAYVNLGAHALNSTALPILQELNVNVIGNPPKLNIFFVFENKSTEQKIISISNLFLTSHLKLKEKFEFIRFFSKLKRIPAKSLNAISLQSFLDEKISSNNVQNIILALSRLATYSNCPEQLSAGVVIRQLQDSKVLYVERGWQTIVDALKKQVDQLSTTIQCHAMVESVSGAQPLIQVKMKDGSIHTTRTVLSTVEPARVTEMIAKSDNDTVINQFQNITPVFAACLDVVLDRLPNPKINFALGVEKPLYFVNHSNFVRLTESTEHKVIHVLKYLNPFEESVPEQVKSELENFLNLLQPGWKKHVISQRFLPKMTVANALPSLELMSKYPNSQINDIRGMYVAGDWVGNEGLLVNKSLESAKKASQLILKQLSIT